MALRKRASIKGGNAASLRMALAGFDVDTASLDQMAFDARFANMERFMQGVARTPVLSTGAATSVTVSFGRSFSTPPLVIAGMTFGDPIGVPSSRWQINNFDIVWNTTNNAPQQYYYLAVGLTAMQFVNYNDFGAVGFQYIVFKPEA